MSRVVCRLRHCAWLPTVHPGTEEELPGITGWLAERGRHYFEGKLSGVTGWLAERGRHYPKGKLSGVTGWLAEIGRHYH